MAEIPWTPADRDSLARLVEAAAEPWDRLDDVAAKLGVTRPAVSHYISGRTPIPWPYLRGLLRATARKFPERVPELAQLVVAELLDGMGEWRTSDTVEVGALSDELLDLHEDAGELSRVARDPTSSPTLIDFVTREVEKEAREVVAAAKELAAQRRKKSGGAK